MKIAEFLNREANANANQSEALTMETSLAQKNTTQVGSSSQVRKPSKPTTTPLAPTVKKATSFSRPYERPRNFLRPRLEDRMIALKPVQIVLPPVMLPFSSPQGIRPQIPPQQFYCRWVGAKTTAPSYLPTPTISRRGEKPKENLPFSLPRHPRPWVFFYRGHSSFFQSLLFLLRLDNPTQDTHPLLVTLYLLNVMLPSRELRQVRNNNVGDQAKQNFNTSVAQCCSAPECPV